MNKARLLACPSCARHVRATELACPFCAASMPETFATTPAQRLPTKRLSRAALYAFGATSMTVATACSSGGGPVTTPAYGGPGMELDGDVFDAADAAMPEASATPLYGASPVDAATHDGSQNEGGVAMPAYGAPVLPVESGTSD
jgi:hypothetical protein